VLTPADADRERNFDLGARECFPDRSQEIKTESVFQFAKRKAKKIFITVIAATRRVPNALK
jgi:hypothetical protein